jgi:EmrB/QacA subfamily drug resistance transporter
MSKSNRLTESPIDRQHWVAPVMIALIGGFMSILDSSIVNVAIPTMMHVFNSTTGQIEWVVTVYMLALGVVIPFSGWAGDRYGYKQLYTAALIMFTIGSFLCTVSWSVDSLIVARIIQALGGGMLMPAMMTMVKKIVPEGNFGTAMGIVGVALLIAPALGPTIGGYLVEYVGWRWIFTINIPIGIFGILLSFFFLPEFEKAPTDRLDVGGAITSAIMLFSLLLALSEASTWGWSSEPIILLLYLSLVTFILFLYIELNSKNPLLNLRMFKSMNFTMANITTMVTTVGLFSGIFYVPLFLQNIKGLGALDTGLIMLPGALVSGLLMPIVGKLYDYTGPRPLAIFGIISLAYTTFLLHNFDINTSTGTVIYWMILRGVGMSFAAVSAQAASLESVSQNEVGGASAITNIVSRVSGSLGIAALTTVLTTRISFHTAMISNQLTSSSLGVMQLMQKFSYYLGGSSAMSAEAKTLGAVTLQGLVQESAFVKGIDDIFMIASILTIFGLVPALFLKKRPKSAPKAVTE